MRRLPVYILLDTSGSMKGEPIHSVNVGLQSMLSALKLMSYVKELNHYLFTEKAPLIRYCDCAAIRDVVMV